MAGLPSSRAALDFAVPVKLWALFCATSGVFLAKGVDGAWMLTLMGLMYLIFQGAFRQAAGCALFYGTLSLLLFLIREHGLRMVIFSEFHIFLFWRMTPVFIAALSLATTPRMARHPFATLEYTLFPMLLHCLQIADRLAVSAVARGIEAPVKRESYYAGGAKIRDFPCAALYAAGTAAFLHWGGGG
jgi:energy-coupling factor transport system permease protein